MRANLNDRPTRTLYRRGKVTPVRHTCETRVVGPFQYGGLNLKRTHYRNLPSRGSMHRSPAPALCQCVAPRVTGLPTLVRSG